MQKNKILQVPFGQLLSYKCTLFYKVQSVQFIAKLANFELCSFSTRCNIYPMFDKEVQGISSNYTLNNFPCGNLFIYRCTEQQCFIQILYNLPVAMLDTRSPVIARIQSPLCPQKSPCRLGDLKAPPTFPSARACALVASLLLGIPMAIASTSIIVM